MSQPNLTFFCELDGVELKHLFSDPAIIAELRNLHASISLGIIDLTDDRAEVVHQLNEAHIPVTAWLLLPRAQGYWFNLDNAHFAAQRYRDFKAWSAGHKLAWHGIGLDIEPDINRMNNLIRNPRIGIPNLLKKVLYNPGWRQKEMRYHALVSQIHSDSYRVESYQLPLIVDERQAGSDILLRTLGLLNLSVDTEVLMLYSSFFPTNGVAMLCSYAPQAQGIGIGITGGGVVIEGSVSSVPLPWEDLQRDLLLGSKFSNELYIFSLEGCVWNDYLKKINAINWNSEVVMPLHKTEQVNRIRKIGRYTLWALSNPGWVALGLLALAMFLGSLRRLVKWLS